jgi:L-malate glycosyltransferase
MTLRYYMEYLKTENVHLVKDMGMIPYKLHKLYGFSSTVVTYNRSSYNYLTKEVKGLKIEFVKRIFKICSLDGVLYLYKNAKQIDILQIFHCTLSSVFYTYAYKLFNKNGKVYLKLDCSHKLVERISNLNKIQFAILNKFFSKVDIMSVEQEQLYKKLCVLLLEQRHKLINIPNGIDYNYLDYCNIKYDYSIKENVILNVARIGAEEKNTEMLLEAFARIKNIELLNWKLKLIGCIEERFKKYIDSYFLKYPNLRYKVVFTGPIEDRNKLYAEYAKSKIFAFTSNFESFGIALIEAAALGNVIISTDVGIAQELVTEGNGKIVAVGDTSAFANALEEEMNNMQLEAKCDLTAQICKEKFDWNKIVTKLYEELTKLG